MGHSWEVFKEAMDSEPPRYSIGKKSNNNTVTVYDKNNITNPTNIPVHKRSRTENDTCTSYYTETSSTCTTVIKCITCTTTTCYYKY